MRPGPKPSVDETRFIPRTPEQEEMLFAALLNTRTGVVQATNIVNTLRDLDKYPRPLSNKLTTSLVTYRRRLREVGIPPWEQDDPPRPSVRLSALLGGARPTGASGGELKSRRRPRRLPPTRPFPNPVAA